LTINPAASHGRLARLSGTTRRILLVCALVIGFANASASQTPQCMVSGYLFKPDASLATNASVNAIQVEKSGLSLVITPTVLVSDSAGAVAFSVPQGSTIWIVATAIGVATTGDVGIVVPMSSWADLNQLAKSAKAPISGFSVSTGAHPLMSLALPDFGISLSAAPVVPESVVESVSGRSATLTSSDITTALNFTPLDPRTVIGAVNASSAQIDEARLSTLATSKLTGAVAVANGGTGRVSQTLAPAATLSLGVVDGWLFITTDTHRHAVAVVAGATGQTAIVLDPTGSYNGAPGHARTINVYWTGSEYRVENRTDGPLIVTVSRLGS
jgi:hypothetical protein